jgi:hypothetical protein
VARGWGHWVPYGILNETNFQTFDTIIKYGILEENGQLVTNFTAEMENRWQRNRINGTWAGMNCS